MWEEPGGVGTPCVCVLSGAKRPKPGKKSVERGVASIASRDKGVLVIKGALTKKPLMDQSRSSSSSHLPVDDVSQDVVAAHLYF